MTVIDASLSPAASRSRARHLSVATALGLLALVAVLVPLFLVPVPPLTDYANHLARMDIIARLPHDPALARFYAIDWALIPNLAIDILVPPLAKLIGIFAAGRLFIALIVITTVSGTWALHNALYHRTHGLGGANALVSMALIYNSIFLLGFTNFLLGIGLALWGAALWLHLPQGRTGLRLLVSTAIVCLLFVCHLFAVGLYGMALFCLEAPGLWRLIARNGGWRRGDGWRRAAGRLTLLGLPFLVLIPALAVSPTMGLADLMVWSWSGKGEGLRFVVETYHGDWEVPAGWAALGVIALLLATRRMVLHPSGWLLLAAGVVTYIALPTVMFGSSYADERLPIALAFLVLGFVRFDMRTPRARQVALACILTIICGRSALIAHDWRPLGRVYTDMRQALAMAEPGSTLLVVEATVPSGDPAFNNAIAHAPCLGIIDRSLLVSTAFTVAGKQILSITPAYTDQVDREDGDPPNVADLAHAVSDPFPPGSYFWQDWRRNYDYVLVLYTSPGAQALPGLLDLVHDGRDFQLYKVIRAADAHGA